MKFALINGEKEEASKGAKGICPACGSEVTAKCGEVKINHWAHKGNRNCDLWWENETSWHRAWKDHFPKEWQEKVHVDEHGERHIADVKTSSGWCIEFQHSPLNPEERRVRNAFYRKLVWVVDVNGRPNYKKQFGKILADCTKIPTPISILRVRLPDEYSLLKEWHDDNILVLFDFQEDNNIEQNPLWFLFPKMPSGATFISPLDRQGFIDLHNNNKFGEIVNHTIVPLYQALSEGTQQSRANHAKGLATRFPDPLAIKTTNTRRSRGRL